MFKNYLRTQRLTIQLIIFIVFWFALFTLSQGAAFVYIKSVTGLGGSKLQDFITIGIYKQTHILFIAQFLFQTISFLLPAFIYAYLADPSPRAYLGITAPKKTAQYWAIAIIAIGMVFVIGIVGNWFKNVDLGSTSRELDKQREAFIQAYLSSGGVWTVLRSIFLMAIVPAFCEEFFFRGVLMKFGQSIFRRWWISIGFSALVFAGFHTSISEFVPIFLAGILLGLVYYWTSSIWLNILLHFLFNTMNVLLAVYQNASLEKSMEQPAVSLTIFGIALVPLAAGIYFLYRKRTPLPDSWSVVAPSDKTIHFDF